MKIDHANIALTERCYTACTHCIASCTPSGRDLNLEDYEKFLNENCKYFKRNGSLEIGRIGDCLLHPQFSEFLDVSLNHGIGERSIGAAPGIPLNPGVFEIHKENLSRAKKLREKTDTLILDVTFHPFHKIKDFPKCVGKEIELWCKEFTPNIIQLNLLGLNDELAEDINKKEYSLTAVKRELGKFSSETFRLHENEMEIYITPHDTVYPLGRASKWLSKIREESNFSEQCPYWGKENHLFINPDGKVVACDGIPAVPYSPEIGKLEEGERVIEKLKKVSETERKVEKKLKSKKIPRCRLLIYLRCEDATDYYDSLKMLDSTEFGKYQKLNGYEQ